MPKTKDALSRYMNIDKDLRRWRPLSSQQLADSCTNKLGKPVSRRAIQQDIKDMKEDTSLALNAPILYDKRSKRFYYERGAPLLVFPGVELNDEETYALLFYTKAASHFKRYRIFNKISDAIQKVLDSTNIPKDMRKAFLSSDILELESLTPSSGVEMIQELVRAVREKRSITFTYKKFEEDKGTQRQLKPLLIKEDRALWYVVGLSDKPEPVTFAIDRISNLKITDQSFPPVTFDSEEYFKYSMGITVSSGDPVDVILSFSKKQGNFIKAVPLHHSQKVLIDNLSEFQISITIEPSYEFYMKILSYGADVKVLAPASVVEHIKNQLSETLKKY